MSTNRLNRPDRREAMVEAAAPVACAYCGHSFLPNPGQATCRSCPLATDCRYLRCPACGYENPVVPRWLGALKRVVAG